MEIINNVTMLSIILAGAAVIREREHGTLEHLLVMPVKPLEIVLSKVLANGLMVLVAATLSLIVMVQYVLQVPIRGSVGLFVLGVALHLFATTSIGIFLGTVARTMPQLGLLFILRCCLWKCYQVGSPLTKACRKSYKILCKLHRQRILLICHKRFCIVAVVLALSGVSY
jgi:ABC-type transport system involved in multi-copper enzyme maturation permease subunit